MPDLTSTLSKLLERIGDFHPHLERKSRTLDYMLALYGERFNQSTLKRVGNQVDFRNEEIKKIVENKAGMLRYLVHFNQNIAKAPDYSSEKMSDQSGFEIKIAILLGIDPALVSSKNLITSAIKSDLYNLNLIDSSNLKREPYKSWEASILIQLTEQQITRGVELSSFKRPSNDQLKVDFLKLPKFFGGFHYLTDTLMQYGSRAENYRLFKKGSSIVLVVGVNENNHKKWYLVNSYDDLNKAVLSGYKIMEVLKEYDRACEKFITIDHVLLRPKGTSIDSIPKEFYLFSCTIVFSKFSLKSSDRYFRELAEETILLSAPSHIQVHVKWFDINEYVDFEAAYDKWRKEPKDDIARSVLAQFLFDKSYSDYESD